MRNQMMSALDGLFAKTASLGVKARGVLLGAVLVASFVSPAAAGAVQGSTFSSRGIATQTIAKVVHPAPDCAGGGAPC